jgi:hypothetical protein
MLDGLFVICSVGLWEKSIIHIKTEAPRRVKAKASKRVKK